MKNRYLDMRNRFLAASLSFIRSAAKQIRSAITPGFVIGIACVLVAVGAVVYMQRGSRVGLTGKVLKLRTAPLDEKSSIVVLDFRFANPSNYPFMVRTVTVVLEEKDGKSYEGDTISEVDAKRLFEQLPLLGPKFNDTLVMRDKIPPETSQDRMVAARFDAPESRLAARKRFVIRIEEVDGQITEISET
ncbi:MAG: hypothetical protein ACLQU1_06525 [Bryobacteraceae bacterium]